MARPNLTTAVLRHITDHGYGIVRFEVRESGEIRHTQTQITIKPEADESFSDFIDRLQTQLMPGDMVEFTINNGKIGLVRIERSSQEKP